MTAFAQNFNTYPGDTISPVYTVQDQFGNPVDISTVGEIVWTASRTVGGPVLVSKAKSAGQIVLVGGGVTGQFQVKLLAADTNALNGVYQNAALIFDVASNQSTVALGQLTVGRAPTWTYDPTQLGTSITSGSPLMQVRRLIGDTKFNDQQQWDEEINFALGQRGYVPGDPSSGVIYGAAADCCRNLAAELSRQVDLVQGELKQNYSNRAKAYLTMASNYEIKASARSPSAGGGVYAGGISVADKTSQNQDSDRVSPAFSIGMTDNPLVFGPTGPETPVIPVDAGGFAELPDF